MPTKDIMILESAPDLADNTYAVYQELIKRGLNKRYKIIWVLKNKRSTFNIELPENVYLQNRVDGTKLDKLKYVFVLSRAKYIIDSNIYVNKMHSKQVRIHLKHGLPMKDASRYNRDIGDVDLISVPCTYWVDVCAKEHGVDSSFIKPLGFARNDELFLKEHNEKIIMWMPTFRNHSSEQNTSFDFCTIMPLGVPLVKSSKDLEKIDALLKNNNAYLLIRLHPAQDISNINLSDMSNIKLCDEEFLRKHKKSLYSILTYTDALISDYSSIYYDYLNLAKPIALAVEDFEQYKKNNGILAKSCDEFKEMYPAQFLENYDDLLAFLQGVFDEDPEVYKCAEAQKKYMGFNDGNAAKRIVDYMEKEFGL